MMVSKKDLASTCASALVWLSSVWCAQSILDKPNIVIFFADDMGFGDLQPFGNPLSRTPHINALERNGLKFTQFYSASSICSPSRAGLLTGRYPVRSGVWSYNSAVFTQNNVEGLPHQEVTIAEMLAKQGYKSSLIGKWHLGIGRDREFLPLHHGFDDFFGFSGSHSECQLSGKCFYPFGDCDPSEYDEFGLACQLFLGDEIIEQPVNMILLAERQARAARSFIQKYACTRTPFYLQYSFQHPHTPHFAGRRHRNSTLGGEYTDSLAELDWQVGEVMDELKKSGVIDNTLVIFTSDNGPDLTSFEKGGFSGVMRCGKRSTFEGGSRVPTIAYWPGRISNGISTEFLSHLDIWPTLRSLSGSSQDDFNVVLDGFDFSDVLFTNGKSPRSSMLFYPLKPTPAIGPYAVRNERYKAHFFMDCDYSCMDTSDQCEGFTYYEPPLLYDLLLDPEERNDLSKLNESKQVIHEITLLWKQESNKVHFGKSVLELEDDSVILGLCCNPGCEPFPSCCSCPSNYTKELFPISTQCVLHPLGPDNQKGSRKSTCRQEI